MLTPQLFVGDSRMCDEDTDLGLEYTLTRMLSPEAERERARRRAAEPPRAPPPPRPAVVEDLQAAVAAKPLVEVTAKPGTPAPPSAPAVAPQAPVEAAAVETPSPSPADEKVQR